MSYRYKQHLFYSIGYSIDQIINSADIKQRVRAEWKYLQQIKRFEEEKLEVQYKKDCTWWDFYSQQTLIYLLKYGDKYNFLRYLRKHIQTAVLWIRSWLGL